MIFGLYSSCKESTIKHLIHGTIFDDRTHVVELVEAEFTHFDKWSTYGLLFGDGGLMDRRVITLRQITEIAGRTAGIDEGVIAMRRRDFLGMRTPISEDLTCRKAGV